MTAIERMKEVLRPLGVYRLDGDTLVEKELQAEACALQELEEEIDRFERELFISTAEEEGLILREKLCGGEKAGQPLSNRRKMLLFRGAVTAAGNTRRKVEEALTACGLLCSVTEFYDRLYINCYGLLDQTLTKEGAVKAAQEFLPAHIPSDFDFRERSWQEIEAEGLTFAQMDLANLTWKQIDSYED